MFTKRFYVLLMTLLINTSFLTIMPVAFATGTLSQTCSTSSVTIPNNTPAGITQTLNVAEGGNINDLNVTLDVTHAQVSELAVTLKQVTTGKTLLLFNQPGMASPPGCLGQNFTGFVIDDQGTKDVDLDCATTNPAYNSSFHYKPSVASLAVFNGEDINGAWELTVSDSFNYSTTNGTLTNWCLKYDRDSAAASLTLSPPNSSTLAFGSTGSPLGTPIYDTINIPETSNLDDLWVYSYAITGTNASEFKLILPSTFPFKVAMGTLYQFKVECKPTAPGTRTATITLNTNIATMQTISYSMECKGIAASYSDGGASATMNFGSSNVNTATPLLSLTLSETSGQADLNVTSSLTGSNPGDFSISPSCASTCTIGKGTSQTYTLGCTPKRGENRTATLELTTNDPTKSTVNYTLNCTGIGPIVNSTPADNATLQFGAVQIPGPGLAKSISLSNGGNQVLNLSVATFSGAGAGAFSFSLAIPTAVPANGGSVSPTVTCNPLTTGSYTATLKIPTDDPNQPFITYNLKCSANTTTEALYNSTPVLPTVTFNVGSAELGGTISNFIYVEELGNATLDVDVAPAPVFTGADASDFSVTGLPFSIPDNLVGIQKTITVTCAPSHFGVHTATLNLTSNATNYPTPTYPVTCTGLQPGYGSSPAVPGGTITFSATPVGKTATYTLNVQETGQAKLTVNQATPIITGTHDTEFGVTTSFPFSINNNGSQQAVNLTCSPKDLGVRTAQLNLTSDDPTKLTITYTLNCTGLESVGPGYGSTPILPGGDVDVGNVFVGVPTTATFEVKELGSAVLEVNKTTNATITGANAGDFSVNPINYFYISDAGTNNTVTVTCTHSGGTPGTVHTATLNMTSTDTKNLTPKYNLKCTAKATPKYNSAPVAPSNAINFGTTNWVGIEVQQTLTIKELGTANLTVSLASPAITGTHASEFTIDTSKFPLTITDGGADVPVTVTCKPGAVGVRTAQLNLTSNDPLLSTITYPLTCTSQPTPGFSSNPVPNSPLDCGGGPVGVPIISKKVQVLETGTANLQVISASIINNSSGDFVIDSSTTFPLTVADGNATGLPITLKITPSVALVQHTATLQLTTNDPLQSTFTYNLTCTGGATPIYLSTVPLNSTINFGQGWVGVPMFQTFEIGNGTGATAQLTVDLATPALTGEIADFAILTPTANPTNYDIIIPNNSQFKQTVTVQCLPSNPDSTVIHTATLHLTSNDPVTPRDLPTYTLKCAGQPTPGYGSTPGAGSRIDFGVVPYDQPVNQTIELEELGTADLTVNLAATPITGIHAQHFSVVATTFPLLIPEDSGQAPTITLQCQQKSPQVIHTALLNLVTNDPLKPTVTYPLRCTGTPTPGYGSSPVVPGDTIDFGNSPVGTPVMKNFNLQEIGSADLTINLSTPAITGPDAADFSLVAPTFPVIIPEGSGLLKNVIVQCRPSQAKSLTATLTLTSNDPVAPGPLYSLRCNGTPLTPSDSTLLPAAGVTLMVSIQGTGNGRVNSNVPDIHCEDNQGNCDSFYQPPTSVILTPIPAEGSEFSSWGGDDDCADGQITMNGNKLCIAYFNKLTATAPVPVITPTPTPPVSTTQPTTTPGQVTLTVQKIGSGDGQWIVDNGVQNMFWTPGTKVTLIAIPNPGSVFKGWSGDCHGMDNSITVTMNQAMNCVAQFDLLPPTPVAHHLLSVVKTGAGQGKVILESKTCLGLLINCGINCGDHGHKCQAAYPDATSITLMAQPETNSTFTGWSGDCVGATSVDTSNLSWSLLMDRDQQCIAQFDLVTPELPTTEPVPSTIVTPDHVVEFSLTMSITGSCIGKVSSFPEEMLLTVPNSPTSPLTMTYPVNTVITFIGTPEPGCQWLNFGGDEDCFDGQVTLSKHLSCTAAFEPLAAATPVVKDEPKIVCPLTDSVDIYCNYHGQTATDLTVTEDGNISNVILDGTINNNGWIANATIKASATLIGGALTGYITNDGIAMDFEFHGAIFTGGLLAGNIINKDRGKFKNGGIIQDVKFAPNSYLSGGKLRGQLFGDAELPVLVESVKILSGSVLTNVILGADVVLEENVTLGPGVIWLNPPTGTTSPVPNSPGADNQWNQDLTTFDKLSNLINDTIDGQGRVMKNVTIGPKGKLRNVILQGNIINQGLIEDATLQDCNLTGGILTGVIKNECTLTDIDFQGSELSGGILAGKIKISRAGTVKNVTLAPNTSLTGGKLSGLVKGDSVAPALLESVAIGQDGYVENVIVGKNVKNRGTLTNIEFRGDLMSGGTLAGTIQNTGDGLIQNVKFNEHAHLLGGKVGGSLAGTPHAPALVENVNAQALTGVKYVSFKQAKALKLKHLDVGPEVTVLKLDTTDTKVSYTEANGEIMTDVVVGTLSRLANAQLQGTIINRGEIANITLLRAESTLTGGILTGEIINQGILIDVEFAGTALTGGWLRGTIRNTKGGLIKAVRLAANAQIKGGKLQGQILGEATAPALLEDLTILAGSEIDNVVIGENVSVGKEVTFGPNVKFIRQPTESTLRLITDQQDAKNERWQDIMVGPQGQISNVTLAGTTLNQGVINEASTALGSTLMGGTLTGRIMNQGTLSDFEFQGTEITGGVLGGKIKVTRNGILYNVRLLGKAYLVGGWLKGRIEGDAENPPLLENVTVLDSGYVNNVIIGDNIENHGTLANFEFRGKLLSGGKVAGSINGNKNGALQNLTLVAGTELRGMRLKGRIKGEVWAAATLENVQIDSDGEVENVIVGDNVVNDGTLMNIEFRGAFLKNSRLAGKIVNTKKGILQDSRLAANAYLTGGSVQGQFLGESSDAPALLENLTVMVGTVLDNVIIGDNVTLPKTVSYGKGVRFLKVKEKFTQYVQAQALTTVTLAESDLFTNVVLQGTNRNRGRIYNMTLRSNSVLSGGRLGGIVYNEGSLLDFEFEGTLLQGGKLGGTVKNTRGGIIKEVTLMAKARLRGGKLQGQIVGEDVEVSALLEEVTILDGSFIDNVIIGERVTMEKAVTFGPKVKFLKQPLPRTTETINDVLDGKGQLFTAVTIGPQGKLRNAVLAGTIINQGVIENVTVQADGIITGGILTGVIVNQGTLSDFEFQGSQLTGGTLSGPIRNTKDGIFQDVKLAPNTWLTGGKLSGRIEGSPGALALLEKVTILEYSYVVYVIVGQWVKNYGTLVNFEFRGDLLIGGKLEGMITITSAGVFQEVILAANAVLRGGHLKGKIIGDTKAPALLEHLLIELDSLIENVIIGEQVVNQGTLTNFELRGSLLTGGTVAGNVKVTNFGTLRNVYLAANAKVTGGRLAGLIKGDSAAPALLDEVQIMGLSYLENVTLTATSKISPYVTFGTQVLTSSSVTTSNTSETAGIGIDANGRVIETQAQFISTLKTSKGEVENHSELSLAEAKKVKLTITLAIDPQHQGQPGEIIVTSLTKQVGQEGTFMRPPNEQSQWLRWDGDPAKLQPMVVYDSLPSVVTVNVFEGDLSQSPGKLTASAGYRLADGTIIYNQTPAIVSVPLADSCLACHTLPPSDEEVY